MSVSVYNVLAQYATSLFSFPSISQQKNFLSAF